MGKLRFLCLCNKIWTATVASALFGSQWTPMYVEYLHFQPKEKKSKTNWWLGERWSLDYSCKQIVATAH